MKYAICKQGSEILNQDVLFGVEEGWVYKVVEDNGENTVVIVEDIVGVGGFKMEVDRNCLAKITEDEYKFVEADQTGEIDDELDKWIARNWPV